MLNKTIPLRPNQQSTDMIFNSRKSKASLDDTSHDGNDGGMNETLDHRLTKVEVKLDHVAQEVHMLRNWLVGGFLTMIGIMVGVVAFQASWFQHSLDVNRDIAKGSAERSEKALDRIDKTLEFIREKSTNQPQSIPQK